MQHVSLWKNNRYVLSNIMYISNSKARKIVYLLMQHEPRNQLFFSSLEYTVLPETPFVLFMFLSKH
jgi:hypothetical protein